MPNFERVTPLPEESSDRISGVRRKSETAGDSTDELTGAEVRRGTVADLPEMNSSHLEQVAGPTFESDAERAFFQPEGSFITKKDAYTAIAQRMEAINEELQDILASGGTGFESRRKELMGQAKELSAHMRAVENATGEETNGLVANPFRAAEISPDASESPERNGMSLKELEASLGPDDEPTREELQAEYELLKERNTEIGMTMRKLEETEQKIVGMISVMHEGTSRMREDLRNKQLNALASLMGEAFPGDQDLISRIENVTRADAHSAGYPEMLNTIGDAMERLADEKKLLLGNMSKVIDRLSALPEQAVDADIIPFPLTRKKKSVPSGGSKEAA